MRRYSSRINSSGFALFVTFFLLQAYAQQRPGRGSIRFGTADPPINLEGELQTLSTVYTNVADAVLPVVVSVIPTRTQAPRFGSFFRSLFMSQKEKLEHVGNVQLRGLGSGVIVSEEGYILTNYHVVIGAERIEIRLDDNRILQATIIGIDSLSDLAVLQLTGDIPDDLSVAYLGDSDQLQPGDWVAAIGNPFRLTSTITAGIVSGLSRRFPAGILYQDFIQTDAAVNPGNSGGPLVNLQGAVVGINTLIVSQTGGFMGIGFAIPINLARNVMEDLIYEGEVIRGWIGITVQDVPSQMRRQLGLDANVGALVADVSRGEPADRAGIRPGDVIISIENEEVTSAPDLINMVAAVRPDTEIPMVLLRDGSRRTVTVTVARR